MKRIKTIVFVLLFLGLAGGCGKTGTGENAADTEWSEVETGTSDRIEIVDEDAVSGDKTGTTEDAGSSENGEAAVDQKMKAMELVEGMIAEQSFEVELDDWGNVLFVSAAPADNKGEPHFVLVKGGSIVYTFPESRFPGSDDFVEVSAVAFTDYNGDGKKDVIVIIKYQSGTDAWNEAEVFLQENSDNMFYMDYPDMSDYRIDAQTKEGPAFYRDTFLEEYLHTQRLTDTVSDITGTWADYDSYVGSLVYGYIDIDRQIELLAEYRDMWAGSVEYADDVYCFTVTDLDYDGSLEVITSNMGGTGFYSDNRFYELDREGNLRELETSFTEGSSQPDLIFDPADTQDQRQMTLYSSFTPEGIRDYYIVRDWCKVSPDCYVERTSSLCMMNDYILETPLATQVYTYEGEDYTEHVVSEDCSGNALTEEEYDNFADTYYSNMGLEKKTASFLWISMSELEGKSDEEAAELIRQAEQGFVR